MKSKESIHKLNNQDLDETKPGLGQYYCISCARYFESVHARNTHMKSRLHKRRVKELKEGPYTQEEADFAAGRNVQKYLKMKEDRNKHVQSDPVKAELDSKPDSKPASIDTQNETTMEVE